MTSNLPVSRLHSLIVPDLPRLCDEFSFKKWKPLSRGNCDGFATRVFHRRCRRHANLTRCSGRTRRRMWHYANLLLKFEVRKTQTVEKPKITPLVSQSLDSTTQPALALDQSIATINGKNKEELT
jgi:hypothetical protein